MLDAPLARGMTAEMVEELRKSALVLPRALDGDESIAAAAAAAAGGRDRARDVVAVDLAERRRLAELMRMAVGGRRRAAAALAGRQAAVDAVAVRIVGDDGDALFRPCRRRRADDRRKRENRESDPHGWRSAGCG